MFLTECRLSNNYNNDLIDILQNKQYQLYIYNIGEDDIIDEEIIYRFKNDLNEYLKTHSKIYINLLDST